MRSKASEIATASGDWIRAAVNLGCAFSSPVQDTEKTLKKPEQVELGMDRLHTTGSLSVVDSDCSNCDKISDG